MDKATDAPLPDDDAQVSYVPGGISIRIGHHDRMALLDETSPCACSAPKSTATEAVRTAFHASLEEGHDISLAWTDMHGLRVVLTGCGCGRRPGPAATRLLRHLARLA